MSAIFQKINKHTMRHLLSLSIILLVSCSSMKKQPKSDTGAANKLGGTTWTLSGIPGFELEQTRKIPSISFVDTTDRVYGNTGCNNFGGYYFVKGNTLKLEKVISTKMACLPGMETETKVMTALVTADHFTLEGDKLTLLKGDKVLAEYTRGKKEQK
jgi:heat shock protein HslJ